MNRPLKFPIVLLLTATLLLGQSAPMPVQSVEPPDKAQKLLKFAVQLDSDAQNAVRAGQRHPAQNDNGIFVEEPKLYDDSLLQQMLNAAQSRLMSLQAIDQSGLTRAIGNITGANQTINSVGVGVGQQTIPASATTPELIGPAVATSPSPSTTLPPSFNGSASDILGEQIQLTAEIANLRLLLEGAISDYVLPQKDGMYTKPRVTLGFPIAITPARDYKDAVAMVEVFVESNANNDLSKDGEPPAVTALLPREKTYNVAAISDNSVSIGGGYAVGLAGAAASFLWGHKTYFIVKDQDTLAMPLQTSAQDLIDSSGHLLDTTRLRAFAWQFRPVLGRHFVETGARQVFVQLAFPGQPARTPDVKTYGWVRIRTYWRKVNAKTGVLGDIIPDSFTVYGPYVVPILALKQTNITSKFNSTNMEDLGTGQMLIKIQGRLLPGSYLRIGPNIIQPNNSGGVPWDLNTTRFVANISDLATLKTFLISRDGTETPFGIKPCDKCNQFEVDNWTTTPIDASNTLLRIAVAHFNDKDDQPPVIVIGGKVFGYSDAPIDHTHKNGNCILSVAVPNALLAAAPVVKVKPLLVNDSDKLDPQRTFSVFSQDVMQQKLVFLSKDAQTVTYLLYGNKLKGAQMIWPSAAVGQIAPLNNENEDTMQLVRLSLGAATDAGPILIARPGERPFEVALPALPKADASAAAAPKKAAFKESVTVGANDAIIVGDNLDPITKVKFGATELKIAKKTTGAIKVTGLAAAGVTAVAKTVDVTLATLTDSSTIPLAVVTNKVDILGK